MQDLSKKIRFLKFRKKLWRSWPYRLYLQIYEIFIKCILKYNKKNVKIIFINGMRRSGNHYLMKTLFDSSESSTIFFNNQDSMSPLNLRNGIQTKLYQSKNVLLIIGFEDLLIDNYEISCDYLLNTYFNNTDHLSLLIVRDIRNNMSSRLNHAHMSKLLRTNPEEVLKTRELWLDHHTFKNESKYATIRYERLVEDLQRIDLSGFFIPELMESKQVLNRYGGGSSFTGNDFNLRYKLFKDDIIYESLIAGFENIDKSIHKF